MGPLQFIVDVQVARALVHKASPRINRAGGPMSKYCFNRRCTHHRPRHLNSSIHMAIAFRRDSGSSGTLLGVTSL